MMKVILAAALAAAAAGGAQAATFNFSYTTVNGITAQGVLEATDFGTGLFAVDDVSGTRDGVAITAYDYDDPTPQSFTYTGGQPSNVDFSFYVGADNYEIRWPGGNSQFGTEFRTDAAGGVSSLLVTSFTLTPASNGVPEPASWAMMIGGFALAGGAMRRRSALIPA